MTLRMESFPLELISAALDIRVQSSEATVASDRAMILNYIAGRPDKDDQGQQIAPLEDSPAYENMNSRLRGFFAALGWKLMLGQPDHRKCTGRLRESGQTKLAISFRGCTAFRDS